jgi:hypothetical protein
MKGLDPGVLLQDRADDPALDAFAAPVDETHLVKTCLSTLLKVLLDNARNVPGGKSVEIDGIFNGHDDRLTER